MIKSLKKCFFLFVVTASIFVMASTNAEAKTVSVSDGGALQNALDEAKEKATATDPYTITLTDSIEIENSLKIYSNTTLICKDGVTIKMTNESNILRLGSKNDDEAKGYYYENITINGGIWDESNGTSTGLKFAHGKNITLKNMTIQNVKNAHLMEVAGVDGLTLDNVIFTNMKVSKDTKIYEAVQLDVLAKNHFKGYKIYEDLPNKNIYVNNCTFTNVPRGIGGHTGILNNPITNVSITNCKFDNLKSCAIQIINVENLTISGNTITNVPRGITVLSAAYDKQDIYLPSILESMSDIPTDTSDEYVAPKADQGIVISNNTITTSGKDEFAKYEAGAIWLNGIDLITSSVDQTDDNYLRPLPVGDYYISGVTVANNTVNTHGFGIKLCDVRNAKVSGNTFTYSGEKAGENMYAYSIRDGVSDTEITGNTSNGFYIGAYIIRSALTKFSNNTFNNPGVYGIDLISASTDEINGNKITGATLDGIYLGTNSKATSINNNEIVNAGIHGIVFESNIKASSISYNTITSPYQNGIYLYAGSSCSSITNNTITDAGNDSISIDKKSEANDISDNSITNSYSNAINIYAKSTVKKVERNKITAPKKSGINVDDGSTVSSITGNTVSSAGSNGISVTNFSNIEKITSNTVKKASKAGIFVGSQSVGSSIKKNTISSPGTHGIYLNSSSAKDVTSNSVSKAAKHGIYTEKATITNINSNKISSAKGNGIYLNKSTTVTNIKKNNISKCKKTGLIRAKNCKVKKTSGNKISGCKTEKKNFK